MVGSRVAVPHKKSPAGASGEGVVAAGQSALAIVRELGFANVTMGALGLHQANVGKATAILYFAMKQSPP